MTIFDLALYILSDAKLVLKYSASQLSVLFASVIRGGSVSRLVFVFIIGSILVSCGKLEARKSSKNSTAGCSQRLNGAWEFGRAPYGCVMSGMNTMNMMAAYKDVVYNEANVSDAERKRFVQEMHSFITDYAIAYLKRREADASSDDIETWKQLILATAHQESYWTQYRYGSDRIFRFFRGDGGHGYGLMQIDDRWHKEFLASNQVYDLEKHLIYALDMLYEARKSTIKNPCGDSASGNNLNRSIYSAYNGGPKSKCRWQSAGNKWSRNDKGFFDKLTGKAWEKEL